MPRPCHSSATSNATSARPPGPPRRARGRRCARATRPSPRGWRRHPARRRSGPPRRGPPRATGTASTASPPTCRPGTRAARRGRRARPRAPARWSRRAARRRRAWRSARPSASPRAPWVRAPPAGPAVRAASGVQHARRVRLALQRLAVVGMRDGDQRARPVGQRAAAQLGDAPLRHHVVDGVLERRHDRALGQRSPDPAAAGAVVECSTMKAWPPASTSRRGRSRPGRRWRTSSARRSSRTRTARRGRPRSSR